MQRTLGEYGADIKNLKDDVAELRKDMKVLVEAVNQAKGGWRALLAVGAISGAIGAVGSKAVHLISTVPWR